VTCASPEGDLLGIWFHFSIRFLLVCAPMVAPASFSPQFPRDSADKSQAYDVAIARYKEFLAHPPKEIPRSTLVKVRADLATAYFMLHQYAESLEVLKAFADDNGGHSNPGSSLAEAQAWLVRGLAYLELDRPDEATPSLRRAVAANSNSGTARLALGDGPCAQRSHPGCGSSIYGTDTPHAFLAGGVVQAGFGAHSDCE